MTHTDVREALRSAHEDVAVPEIDQVAFARRVRAARRRGTARTAGIAGLAVAAAAAVALPIVVPAIRDQRGQGGQGGPASEQRIATGAPTPAPAGVSRVPLLLGRRLTLLLADGSSYEAPRPVEEVLGRTASGVVQIEGDSHLSLVPVASTGELQAPVDLADSAPVQRAAVAPDGRSVAYVDLDGWVHIRKVSGRGVDDDALHTPLASPDSQLLAVSGLRWLELDGDRLLLREGRRTVELETAFPALDAEIAGTTVSAFTIDGMESFEAATGQHRSGSLGWAQGALSPSGTQVVSAPDDEQYDQQNARGIQLTDTTTERLTEFTGLPDDLRVSDLAWQGDDRFLVLATDPDRPGNVILNDCSIASGACTERLDDPTGTLALPTGG